MTGAFTSPQAGEHVTACLTSWMGKSRLLRRYAPRNDHASHGKLKWWPP